MTILQIKFGRFGQFVANRRLYANRIRHFRRLLQLSDADLAGLDITRAEIRNRMARLHIWLKAQSVR